MTTYTSAAAIPDVGRATFDELKARFVELAGVVDAVGAERKALQDEIRRREAEAAMLIRMAGLNRDGKRVLRAVVNSSEFAK